MIQSDRTICATAERAEIEGDRYLREENIPKKWLGIDATWRERRLFDWRYLAASFDRSGDLAMANYAKARAAQFEIS